MANTTSESPSKRSLSWRRLGFVSVVLITLTILVLGQLRSSNCTLQRSIVTSAEDGAQFPNKWQSGARLAQSILQKSHDEAFSTLVNSCGANETLHNCIIDLAKTRKAAKAAGNDTSQPWWFDTLIRDAEKAMISAWWHSLVSKDPPLAMCTIEKVGTTQWRRVFARLKHSNCTMYNPTEADCCAFNSEYCFGRRWKKIEKLRKTKVVFLRDPLERFLSAYLNKCEKSMDRQWCKPTVVFSDVSDNNLLLKDMTERQRFSAYVDVVPLNWDLHFYPQSLICDGLYRTIDTYDFVGKMDTEFYQHLDRLTAMADEKSSKKNRMRNVVQDIFETTWDRKNSGSEEDKKSLNLGTETRAPSHVLEYYTARTVRRVLEYTALDYLTLDLEVPTWALEMLQSEANLSSVG